MSAAVCVRCGAERQDFSKICPECGHRPDGDGLLVAWLLSEENLGVGNLGEVQRRIRGGEKIRPSARMLDKARRALGSHYATDAGLPVPQLVALLATNLLLTPLVGWVLAAWWWGQRPRAAVQSLALTVPVAALFFVGVLYLRGTQL